MSRRRGYRGYRGQWMARHLKARENGQWGMEAGLAPSRVTLAAHVSWGSRSRTDAECHVIVLEPRLRSVH